MIKLNKSLYDYLKAAAVKDGERVFLFNEEIRMSFQDVYSATVSISNKFHRFGIKTGELVAFRMTRSIESIIIYFALQFLGAIAVLIDPHNNVESYLSSLNVKMQVRFVITNENTTSGISAQGGWIIIDKTKSDMHSFDIYNYAKNEQVEFCPLVDIRKPAMILFSSGSTGKNKAAIFNQFAMIENTLSLLETCEYSQDSVLIATLPLCHMYAMACIIYTSVIVRHSIFIPVCVDVLHVIDCIEKYGVNFLVGVPSMYTILFNEYNRKLPIVNGIGMISGAPCDPITFKAYEHRLGITLFQLYGMTEGGTFASCKTSLDGDTRALSVGKLMSRRDGKIVGEDGSIKKIRQVGEICVKSPSLMLGYYNDFAATVQVIDENGFLHTGDMGYIDENQNLYITGRKKEIIIRNGVNLSISYIQSKIVNLKFVKDCAVIGIKDDKVGEVPAAAIVLNDGYSISSCEIMKAMADVLTKIEIPDRIIVLDSLPITATGKIDKKAIGTFF